MGGGGGGQTHPLVAFGLIPLRVESQGGFGLEFWSLSCGLGGELWCGMLLRLQCRHQRLREGPAVAASRAAFGIHATGAPSFENPDTPF